MFQHTGSNVRFEISEMCGTGDREDQRQSE